ncbi:MAG: aminoglycoside phosphotransferase family protein [Pseudomonadota bacterium]
MKIDSDVAQILGRLGLVEPGEYPEMEALTGGVSSDIWKVTTSARAVCIKRALAKLKVEADWHAPIERNAYEAAWMQEAAKVVPDAVPELLGQDQAKGLLVMEYLEPKAFVNWKEELRRGRADVAAAAAVGACLARIHNATAYQPEIAAQFPTDQIFYEIRLEPYLIATAKAHPQHAAALNRLVDTTQSTKRALVHGDVSPKNILIGESGPVFLDAECAWYGDPAFDLAFCLNHLLLKGAWVPTAKAAFLACYGALHHAYLDGVTWEEPAELEARVACLLPGLLLGRIDGKSPVEYIVDEPQKDRIRSFATERLSNPPQCLNDIREAWAGHDTNDSRNLTVGDRT